MRTAVKMGAVAPKKQVDTSQFTGRFAKRLTTLREEAGLTVEKFASKLTDAGYEIRGTTIYSWEQGRSSPHVEAFPAIAKVLKIAIADILPKR